MKTLRLFLIVLTIPVFTIAQPLTLEQSIDIGLKNSKELKISKSKLIGYDAKITEVGSHMLPQLKLSAGYTRLSDVPDFTVSVPGFLQSFKIQDVVLNNYQVKLSLQQSLFTGFRLSSLKSVAEYNYTASELDYDKNINEYAFKIQSAFWNFYKAKLIKLLLEETLKQIEKHLQDTKNYLENQLVTKNDVLKLEVQYSNTELALIEAENNLDLAKINFNRVLGIDLDSQTDIKTEDINLTKSDYDLDDITIEAIHNRKELQSMEYRLKSSEEVVTAANSNWFPTVSLFGNVYYQRPNQRYLPLKDIDHGSWDVGIALSWNVWNWGYNSSQTTQAEQNYLQAQTTLSELKDAVQVEVYQSYLTYKRSFDKVDVSRKSVEQANENYRIMQQKYDEQLATSTDLIDAEVSVLQAKTNLTNSLVDYQLTKVHLEKAIGRKIY
jgi:outer membrane protein